MVVEFKLKKKLLKFKMCGHWMHFVSNQWKVFHSLVDDGMCYFACVDLQLSSGLGSNIVAVDCFF